MHWAKLFFVLKEGDRYLIAELEYSVLRKTYLNALRRRSPKCYTHMAFLDQLMHQKVCKKAETLQAIQNQSESISRFADAILKAECKYHIFIDVVSATKFYLKNSSSSMGFSTFHAWLRFLHQRVHHILFKPRTSTKECQKLHISINS